MSNIEEHYRKLERMYQHSAPINVELYNGIKLSIAHERAELILPVEPKFFHSAHSLHGSVYFKMLDDAAFFAVNSIVMDVFVYTVTFNIQMLRPVTGGIIKSVGELKFKSTNLFVADSTLYDQNAKAVGRGTGSFMKSKISLNEGIGYK